MNLIVQGLEVSTGDLKQLAKLARAGAIEAITPQAFRLRNADQTARAAVARHCNDARLDYAFVAEESRLDRFKLVAFDMDSTLIAVETLDELADFVGQKEQVAAVTEAAMRGEIDHIESLKQRVLLLRGLDASALASVFDERVRLMPGAAALLAHLKSLGIKTLLATSGFRYFTERLKAELGLDFTADSDLEIEDGKLTGKMAGPILDAQGKADALARTRASLGLKREQTLAIADGANDLLMLAEAGTSIAFHAKPVVREHAAHCINYVGLEGVVHLFA